MAPAPAARSATTKAPTSAKVVLDLDKLEREQSFEPFVIRVGGKSITLIDPQELDWQVAASLSRERMFEFFQAVVQPDDYDAFLAAKFPRWKMERLLDSYREHFGLGDEGN